MFRTSSVHHQERFYKLYSQIWYVVIRVLLDTSSRYEATPGRVEISWLAENRLASQEGLWYMKYK